MTKMHPIIRACTDMIVEIGNHATLDAIIVGFSGGPDSTVLLDALCRAASVIASTGANPPHILAAHCNFHLRNEESDRDMRFAQDFCYQKGVELLIAEFDTKDYCRREKISVELGARRLRHDWLKYLCNTRNALLATGHNADDNAETLFLNLMRGSGSRGLKGMLPKQRHIIRPLLRFSREEIMQYLETYSLPYVTDSTNLTVDYRRNFIRHEVFPLLRSRWQGADRAIATSLRCLADDNAVVEQTIEKALCGHTDILPWSVVKDFAAPVLLILRWLEKDGCSPEIAAEMAGHASNPRIGAYWKLSPPQGDDSNNNTLDNLTAHNINSINMDSVVIEVCSEGLSRRQGEPEWTAPDAKWEQVEYKNGEDMTTFVRLLPLDCCALPYSSDHYEWRPPHKGQRMLPLGMKGSRLVSDILHEAHLDRSLRSKVAILCRESDGAPIWIPGIKRSRLDLIPHTSKICQLVTTKSH